MQRRIRTCAISVTICVGAALAACAPESATTGSPGQPQVSRPLPANCVADKHFTYFGRYARRWRHPPDVVILGSGSDYRVALVRDAVDYWNRQFERLNSGFRLGNVSLDSLPYDVDSYMPLLSRSVMRRERDMPDGKPEEFRRHCGSIVVVLSGQSFISFGRSDDEEGFVVIGIKGGDQYPMRLSNVARNLIAHEFGHAIGLGHNKNPDALMCGRPASCGPTRYESNNRKYFPLTESEKHLFRRRYPSDWRAEGGR